jgi:hypothetical protein
MAALLLCVLGAARAESDVYKFYLPHSNPPVRIEWSNPGVGWTVTVEFDSKRCEIFCTYRRVAHYLPPPPTVITIYRDFGSAPETRIVDPAGLRFPKAVGRPRLDADPAGLPERGLAALGALAQPAHHASSPRNESPILIPLPGPPLAAAPLRI